jgi:hypothetical protein
MAADIQHWRLYVHALAEEDSAILLLVKYFTPDHQNVVPVLAWLRLSRCFLFPPTTADGKRQKRP